MGRNDYVYPKGMKDCVVRPVFEEKTKPHVTEMLYSVLEMRDTGEEPEQVQVPDLPKKHRTHSAPTKRGPSRTACIQIWKKIKQVKNIEIQKSNSPPKMPLAFTLSVFYFWNRLLKVF